ncbi:hypothetical protein Aperf_G00000101951 [Anoplocephala perfoliata]
MPKVFKPKIRPGLIQKNKKADDTIGNVILTPVVSPLHEQQPKSSDNLEKPLEESNEREVTNVVETGYSTLIEKAASPQKCALSPGKNSSPTKSTDCARSFDADIDAVISNPTSPKTLEPSSPIKLFAVKSIPRKQHIYGEAPPPADKPLDRSTVTLRSLLNWVPVNKPPPRVRDVNPNPRPSKITPELQPKSPSPKKNDPSPVAEESSDDQIDPFAPQLRLDADGNLVLDERSLHVQRPVDESVAERVHITEDAGLYGTTYSSFRRRPIQHRGRMWTEKDTTRFYRALSTIGTDFYSMMKLFPGRTRSQLLKKFKREERLFPHLVDDALKNKRNYDITVFYTSESDSEEKYDKLTKEAINAKRKARRDKSKKEPKPRSTCDISALIDEVLARDVTAATTNEEEDEEADEDGERPRKKPREGCRDSGKSPPVNLNKMIEKVSNVISS